MGRTREVRFLLREAHHTLVSMAAFAAGCDVTEYAREAVVRRAMADHQKLSPELRAIVTRELTLDREGPTPVPAKSKAFVPPTLAEVKALIKERGYHFDPEGFLAYWEARDWRFDGGRGAQVKSWKACCVTFEKNEAAFGGRGRTVEHTHESRELSEERAQIERNKKAREREEAEKLRALEARKKELEVMDL